MPYTVNGIGTTYYGKKNVEARPDVCEKCKRQVDLVSYETRLWFVVVFIPIIPLGKKQILDYCPSCTYHRAIPVAEWNRIKEEALNESARQMTDNPEDPKAAMEMLSTLVAFHKKEDAGKLAEYMKTRFADDAEVWLYLGAWHELDGYNPKAGECFARALELEPENKEAKRAVAFGCIVQGDLARARKLLAFMEQPGPDCDASVLLMLGQAYQQQEKHAEALAVLQMALRAKPELGQDKDVRKVVKRSEKALGEEKSLLPKKRLSCSAVLVVLVAGAAATWLIAL